MHKVVSPQSTFHPLIFVNFASTSGPLARFAKDEAEEEAEEEKRFPSSPGLPFPLPSERRISSPVFLLSFIRERRLSALPSSTFGTTAVHC